MIDKDWLSASIPPGIITGLVATGGFMCWIRYRRKLLLSRWEAGCHFAVCTTTGTAITYTSLSRKDANKKALSRMLRGSEGVHQLASGISPPES